MEKDTKAILEELVDSTSVSDVLQMLSEIYFEKSEHIRDNWQDEPLARIWERAGNRIAAFHAKLGSTFVVRGREQ
jgi:hypothetical protein